MATGTPPTKGTTEERKKSLTCSLCLEVFTSPKLLPCSHSYCLKCLEDLTSRTSSSSFMCPQCRHNVTIPAGGVSAFQNNYYLHAEDLDRARDGTLCLTHPKLDLDLYCVDCQLPLCAKCVLADHRQHDTTDVCEAASQVQAQLKRDEVRVQEEVSRMIKRVTADEAERQAVQDKKAAVESAIRRKHATLVAMGNKFRDDSLASLNTVTTQLDTRLTNDLHCQRDNLRQLCQLQQQLQDAVSGGKGCQQLTVAKEMREGRGSPQAVSKLTLSKRSSVGRPVLICKITEDDVMQNVQDFFGSVETAWMEETAPDVKVVEQFRCGEVPDIEVFSLCPFDNGTVWMSFARRGLNKDAPGECFDEKGKHLNTQKDGTGKTSLKSLVGGKGIFIKQALSTYVKSQTQTNFKLDNSSSGKAYIKTDKVTSEDPYKVEDTTEFIIQVGAHRALDVDSSEQLFVVVEEAQAPDGQRKVHLYRRGQQAAVATYSPPTARCRPSDVCFYKVAGQERLVVADEATDSLHVVSVQGGEMRFERYLAPGCPLLVQPTALNTDTQGRLWVACRGGAILTFTPIA
ncbi:tripartite motif-containing protein 55-like [Littorina saxatilis]|uniref:tripartite motif-containing protein 55-like n=1 Tax=Littorina saxatilis TaxID=31220 RepID=UPI0038B69B10